MQEPNIVICSTAHAAFEKALMWHVLRCGSHFECRKLQKNIAHRVGSTGGSDWT